MKAWEQAGYPIAASTVSLQRSVKLTYSVTVSDIPEKTNRLNVWIPMPRTNSVQSLRSFRVSDSYTYTILTDGEYNNRFLYIELSEEQIGNPEVSLNVLFRVNRESYKKRGLNDDRLRKGDPVGRFLRSDNLVPVDGKIAEEASFVVGDAKDPSQQAKLLFDHIVDTINYDKSGIGWGAGDAIHAFDIRMGDCTDFHSLFIGEARSLGIPARFIMGFPLPSDGKSGMIEGYHCWVEFYVEGQGWIPIDALEAKKRQEERGNYFGNLDANRISFTLGRDIQLPGALSNPVKNYIIYPYAEADGKEISVEWKMTYQDL